MKPELSIGAQFKLAELEYAKSHGIIKDFYDFVEDPPMSGIVKFKCFRNKPIERVTISAEVGFNFNIE